MRARRQFIFVALAMATSAAGTSWAQNETGSPQAAPRPSASQAGAPPATAKEPAPPPSITIIGARDAHAALGRDVRSAAEENMGPILDVIVDGAGVVRSPVIDLGGFFGVGIGKLVVDGSA